MPAFARLRHITNHIDRTLAMLPVTGLVLSLLVAGPAAASPAQAAEDLPPLSQASRTLTVTELQSGLDHPWAMAFLPEEEGILITERPGTLRLWRNSTGLSEPLQGVPEVYARNQGGLLDVALAPDFQQSRRVYLTYAEQGDHGKAGTTAGYGVLSEDGQRLDGFKVVFQQMPRLSSGHHFGSKLVFDGDGHLFIALGEHNERAAAQDLDKLQGKVVRILPDGGIPDDNPFVGHDQARPEIWSYGQRNQQGAAINPWTGQLWTHEHGPRGGDEINIPQAGKNYGWPLATYGVNYSGFAIPEAQGQQVPGTEQPVLYWKVSPAISGMAFYNADRFDDWSRSLFVGALKDRALIRLQLGQDGHTIVGAERLLEDRGERIRDVRVGPDGYVYALTDASDGKLLKIGLQP